MFLAIFENLLEIRPELCVEAGKQGLLTWLLKRIKVKAPFNTNKLYASEILSILLQNSKENKVLIGELDGIDVLLQQLAVSFIILFYLTSLKYLINFERNNYNFSITKDTILSLQKNKN